MDKEELQKNIALYYSKLPPKLQEMFSSMKWLETLQGLGSKYALNDTQKETLGTETTLVLLGIIHPEEYEEILRKELGMEKDILNSLILDINRSILWGTRDEIADTFYVNNESMEEKELDERFTKLSKPIQDAIVDSNYHAVLYQIADSNKLTIEQMGTLEKLTTDVMLGVTPPANFEEILRKNLNLPSEKTATIVEEINERILKSIRMKTMSFSVGHKAEASKPITELEKHETMVLGQAGIKILDPKGPELSRLEISAPQKEMFLPEKKPVAPSILANKLMSTFQTPATKTEHGLENISKPTPASYPPKADPYRLQPEE